MKESARWIARRKQWMVMEAETAAKDDIDKQKLKGEQVRVFDTCSK
jgi:hypothetical protein